MKDGLLKIFTASPSVTIGDPDANCEQCVELAKQAAELGGGVILFPELTLTCATLGDLYRQSVVTDAALGALDDYISKTASLDLVSVIGLPVRQGSRIYSCMAVVSSGELCALIPKRRASGVLSGGESACGTVRLLGREVPLGTDFILDLTYPASASLAVVFADELISASGSLSRLVSEGASLVLSPAAMPIYCDGDAPTLDLILSESRRNSCAIAYANASFGESGTDALYSGGMLICECGKTLAQNEELSGRTLILSEVDFELIRAVRQRAGVECRVSTGKRVSVKNRLLDTLITREYPRLPYIDKGNASDSLLRIIKIQARALAGRVTRSHSEAMVLGVSGGLDSTLALLAATEACDLLGVGKDRVIALTMPGFGTSSRTKGNAELLCEALGVTLKTVDIKDAVARHLADIGHDGKTPDATYENAQARERTQVLMDIANKTSGIVVGTGDLSELALGFCTYNGDHMSMYSVNASLPKTLMRMIVKEYAETKRVANGRVWQVLTDILNTPISP